METFKLVVIKNECMHIHYKDFIKKGVLFFFMLNIQSFYYKEDTTHA